MVHASMIISAVVDILIFNLSLPFSCSLVSKLTEHIKVKSSAGDEDGEDFDQYFPSFIWVVRDFTLEKIIDGKEVTSDEYMEHCLKLKKGRSKDVANYNLAR